MMMMGKSMADKSSHNMMQHLTAMKRRGKLRGKSKSHDEANMEMTKKVKTGKSGSKK